MAQYMTFEQYIALGGTLPLMEFTLAEVKARARIDAMTQGRVANMVEVPLQVQVAMMEIMAVDGAFSAAAQAAAPVAASFTTDGYSETYGSAESRTAAIERQLTSSIETLLNGITDDDGVPLLYAGVPVAGGAWIGGIIP